MTKGFIQVGKNRWGILNPGIAILSSGPTRHLAIAKVS